MFIAFAKRCLLMACLLQLAACSWLFGADGVFPDRSDDYLETEVSAPLELPEGLSEVVLNDDYPVPELEVAQQLPDKFTVPRVDPLDTVENKGSVRIQRFNDQQWILVNAAPGQIWPLVRQFLASNEVALTSSDGQAGTIETDWLRFAAGVAQGEDKGSQLERYQFMLRPGVQANTTEIIVDHQFQAAGDAPPGASTERETNMVTLLAEHLANSPGNASHSLLAQGIGSASKVSLEYDDAGKPFLRLQLPFDRGWASLGLALEKASYQVNDLDRSAGTYFVHYNPNRKPAKKPGFFARLFGAGNDKEPALPAADAMRVLADHDGEALRITIRREQAPALKPNEQAFMLRRIQNKLS